MQVTVEPTNLAPHFDRRKEEVNSFCGFWIYPYDAKTGDVCEDRPVLALIHPI